MGARKKNVAPAPPTRDSELLAAILAAPADDAPRLVYADHLLESADEAERERGEFIIAQCAVEQLPKRSEEWRRARAREAALAKTVRAAPPKQVWSASQWARGFPLAVGCAPAPLRKAWPELARLPIERLALYASRQHRAEVTLDDIAFARKRLPQLRTMNFGNDDGSGTLEARHLDALEEGKKTVAWPVAALPHGSLREGISALSLERTLPLYLREPLPLLERLTIRAHDAEAMLAMSDRPLSELTWHANGDGRLAGERLAKLATFSRLKRLSANVRLDRKLAAAIATSSLEELTLSYDATDAALAELVAPPSLRRLTLHFSGGAWHNCTAERVKYRLPRADYRLESLELGRFIIDESFGELSFPSVHRLNLVECIIEPGGIAALAKIDGLYRPELLRCIISAPNALRERWPDVVIA